MGLNAKYYCVFYDTLKFHYGEVLESSYPLFGDDKENTEFVPIFDSEVKVVKKYFNKSSRLNKFFNNLFNFEPVNYLYERVSPFFNHRSEGELDLILVNNNIRESVAIEFKRIANKMEDSIYLNYNKIQKLADQANRSYDLGFHKVYAGIIIDVSGFKNKNDNVFFRTTNNTDLIKITRALREKGLHENVGILLLEVAFLTEKQLENQGGLIIGIFKEAKAQEQSSDISEKIAKTVAGDIN